MAEKISMHQARRTTALFAMCMWLTACATSLPTREESILVAGGASVEMNISGDADGDGDADVLVVIDHERSRGTGPRGLMIFLRGPDGSLAEALDSPNAILCRTCGGMMGDPLQSVRAEKGELTLRFEGGSRELWSSEYTFAYVPEQKQWRLIGIVHHGLDRVAGVSAERRQSVSVTETVSLDLFDPADYPADAIP